MYFVSVNHESAAIGDGRMIRISNRMESAFFDSDCKSKHGKFESFEFLNQI